MIDQLEKTRYCKKCDEDLPVSEFGNYGGVVRYRCIKCNRKIQNEHHYKHRDIRNKRALEAYIIRSRKNKLLALSVYSDTDTPRCVCCHETFETFLTLDHVNNDGAEDRKKRGSGSKLYNYLNKKNYPVGFQVLCFNCNFGRWRLKCNAGDLQGILLGDKIYEITDVSYYAGLRRRLRHDALVAYAGEQPHCDCCGETFTPFLTFDHKSNDGSEKRKKHGSGLQFYRWLRDNNYPRYIRVLCYNCNTGRSILGCTVNELKRIMGGRS